MGVPDDHRPRRRGKPPHRTKTILTPHLIERGVTVYHGDSIQIMGAVTEASIDAVVCDPPYALEFMGSGWDRFTPTAFQAWCESWGREAIRVLKPGGHLLAFGGTRTYHRLTCGLEDAGFEIRDCIAWLYGSGFPKSMDVSKAIDRAAGAEREVVGVGAASCEWIERGERCPGHGDLNGRYGETVHAAATLPATPAAKTWQGFGTNLKPAFEPVVVARKPIVGPVAANVLKYGTGALNIDACRVAFAGEADERESKDKNRHGDFGTAQGGNAVYGDYSMLDGRENFDPPGRWPANVVLDEDAADMLDEQTGELISGSRLAGVRTGMGYHGADGDGGPEIIGSAGGPSRFFYTSKAGSAERLGSRHPTVKPVDLMRWLVRLVTPPGGVVLDPFAGSGTTGQAAIEEGFACILIEREAEYLEDIARRLRGWGNTDDSLLEGLA